MRLKAAYRTKDEIPSELISHYEEVDGVWVAQVERVELERDDGKVAVYALEDVGGLRASYQDAIGRRKRIAEERDNLTTELADLRGQLEELQKSKAKGSDQDDKVRQREAAEKAALQAKISELEQDKLRNRLDQAIGAALDAAKVVRRGAVLDHLRVPGRVTLGEDGIEVTLPNGKPFVATNGDALVEYVRSLRDTDDYAGAFAGTGATGSGGRQGQSGGSGGGTDPFKTMSAAEQLTWAMSQKTRGG